MLQERAEIIRQIRSFFNDKKYLELDTPLLSEALIPESCLEVFETQRILPNGKTLPYWLIPSPEIWMKKIIARHKVSVFQICKCFRNGESSGFLHNPEFTMLEYYTVNADYMDSLKLTEELFSFMAHGKNSSLHPPFKRLTLFDAFKTYAGFDLFAAVQKPGGLEKEALSLGLDPPPDLDTATLYDLIFIHCVEPELKKLGPIALLDYPAFVPCLAKKNPDGKTVQRWELYFNGIELANCYSEQTDAKLVQDFFESESKAKEKNALVKHKIDGKFRKIFETGFPACSGVALGLDRLIMAITGRSSIDSVLPLRS